MSYFSGYDGPSSMDMHGMEVGSHHGSNYGPPMDNLPDLGPNMDLSFDHGGNMHPGGHQVPHPGSQHGGSADQMAAWFDTDL